MAAAIVAAKAGRIVAHVGAGLRSRDWTMPEEINRVVTDRVSDLLLAPSPDAVENLLHILNEVATDLPVVFPAHPRTLARLGAQPMSERIHLLEPQGYLDFVALQAGAACVLTDSGGIQEETTVLGVPCLTLRDNTERPITISEGTNRLAGRDPAAVLAAYHEVRANPPAARRPELWTSALTGILVRSRTRRWMTSISLSRTRIRRFTRGWLTSHAAERSFGR